MMLKLRKGGRFYRWCDFLGEVKWRSSDRLQANLCPVFWKTVILGCMGSLIAFGIGLGVWKIIQAGWNGLIAVLAGVAIAGGIIGLFHVAPRVRDSEMAEVVRAWAAAKKGRYCPEVEFVEEDE